MIAIIFYLIIFVMMLVRLLRWLAIFQQKEYRTDRIILFLKSREGLKNLFYFLPPVSGFNVKKLKRPVRTLRVYVFGFLSIFVVIFMAFFAIIIFSPLNLVQFFGVWLAIIFSIPLILYLLNLPINAIKFLIVFRELNLAKKQVTTVKPLVIGITGSYGKSSTKLLLGSVLSQEFSVFMTPKSYNTLYGVAKSINKGLINQEIALLEYGAYTKGEIKHLAKWFKPDFAVITGLSPQHLGLFGSLENIVKAKSELIKALPKDREVFCNSVDQGAMKICLEGGAKKIIDYSGKNSVAGIREFGINEWGELFFVWNGKKVQTKMVGEHYIEAIQACIVIGKFFEMKDANIILGIQGLEDDGNFIRSLKGKNNSLIIDDGNTSNPKGFSSAIDLINDISHLNKYDEVILITAGIVDLGEESNQIHLDLAKKAHQVFTKVFFVGENGQDQFKSIFKDGVIFETDKIQKIIFNNKNRNLFLVEGKVPSWIYQAIN